MALRNLVDQKVLSDLYFGREFVPFLNLVELYHFYGHQDMLVDFEDYSIKSKFLSGFVLTELKNINS
jgi:hypothetical protein